MNKQRHLILIWVEGTLIGSHMNNTTKWRPFTTHLTIKEIVKEHEDQFGNGIVDVLDVTDPANVHSVFAENG